MSIHQLKKKTQLLFNKKYKTIVTPMLLLFMSFLK